MRACSHVLQLRGVHTSLSLRAPARVHVRRGSMAARGSAAASLPQAADSSSAAAKALLLERYVAQQVEPYRRANVNAARALASLQQLPVRVSRLTNARVTGRYASHAAARQAG
jgi:hypothetical protein